MKQTLKDVAAAAFIIALGAAWIYALWHPAWWLT